MTVSHGKIRQVSVVLLLVLVSSCLEYRPGALALANERVRHMVPPVPGVAEDVTGSPVVNQLARFWEHYKWQIVGLTLLCLLQGLTITGMLVQRSQREQAERRFRDAIESAPTGMLMIDSTGRVILANAEIERLFGYPKQGLLGQPVELLLPERLRSAHVEYRKSYLHSPSPRPMGVGRELFGRRIDGSEFPLEIGLSPVRSAGRLAVVASVADISERRQAELKLRESQLELRELTGRLLSAQEGERHRIARELHDDFSQSLALLSVEMDLLKGQLAAYPELQGSIDELATGVRQLSTSVHELSHQLHPFKLDQIGLVAAVRGLGQEVTQSYNLPIDVQVSPLLPEFSSEEAVCLYRIAQEALRNVIRHSGADSVQIMLDAEDQFVTLTIADNGSGFDTGDSNCRAGLGLLSMRERLHHLQGNLTIESRIGDGTRIVARIPRQPPASLDCEPSFDRV